MKGFKNITIIFLVAGLLISAVPKPTFAQTSCSSASQNSISITTRENTVSVQVGQRPLLLYRYKNVPFKPYVQQLFSPAGVNILRDAPADHQHHHALMFAVKVDGVNFWEETQATGRQEHESLTGTRTDVKTDEENDKHRQVSKASFTELIDWIKPVSQELLLKEHRTIEVSQ
jgi:hypothetical protein